MRDSAKGRIWWILIAIALMVAATLFVDRWMHG